MNTKDVQLIFMDSIEKFKEVKSQISHKSFKEIHQFETFKQLENFLIDPRTKNEYIVVFIHIVAATLEGYHSGLKDDIQSVFPNLKIYWITRATSTIRAGEIWGTVYTYHQIKEFIQNDAILPQNVSVALSKEPSFLDINNAATPFKAKYVIITALEEDEMETVLPLLIKEGSLKEKRILIEYGHLAVDSTKKIAYASQPATGMIDAAILATEMICLFHPEFLIMAGVLGGKPGVVNIGDIIVTNKVFTIDKGKLTDDELKKEMESCNTNSAYVQSFMRNKKDIIRYIEDSDPTRSKHPNIHFGPIACVRQVIDKKDYFDENILTTDRKTIGLEMESYGIARACELVNNGVTIPLIIKSAMDNTVQKLDDAKKYAAWTSATFVKYILENNLI